MQRTISHTLTRKQLLHIKTTHLVFMIGLISSCMLSSCIQEDMLKTQFVSYQPQRMDDGWKLSTPENEGIDGVALADIYRQFHTDNALWQVRSMLVFRNGKLVAESYTKDPNDAIIPRAVWSCTKQVMGLLTGIAIQHKILAISDSLGELLPEVKNYPDKGRITLRHLLTMRSGIDFQNDGLSGQTQALLRQLPDNSVNFILERPLESTPGEKFHYTDGSPHLISAVIQHATGKRTRDWAQDVLFSKIGVQHLKWEEYRDGVTFGGFGILTTPRELAKFGQIVLDSGRWNGVPIVNSAWIQEMTTEISNVDVYSAQFGYLWWLYKSRSLIAMDGHGGQYVFIAPKKKLVIVMTAEVNTQGKFQFLNTDALRWVDKIVGITR